MWLLINQVLNNPDKVIIDRNVTTTHNGSNYISKFQLNNIKIWYNDGNEYSLTILSNMSSFLIEICSCKTCMSQVAAKYNQIFDILNVMRLYECVDNTLNITFVTDKAMPIRTHMSIAIWLPAFSSSITEIRLESLVTVMFIYTNFQQCRLFSSSKVNMRMYATQNDFTSNQAVYTDKLIIKDVEYHPVYIELDPVDGSQTIILILDIPQINISSKQVSLIQVLQFQQALNQIAVDIQNNASGTTIFIAPHDIGIKYLTTVDSGSIYYSDSLRKYHGETAYIKFLYLEQDNTYINDTFKQINAKHLVQPQLTPFTLIQGNTELDNKNEKFRQFQYQVKQLLDEEKRQQDNSKQQTRFRFIQQDISQDNVGKSTFRSVYGTSKGILNSIFKLGWVFLSVQDKIVMMELNKKMQGSDYYLLFINNMISNTAVDQNNQTVSGNNVGTQFINNIQVTSDTLCLIQSNNVFYFSLSLDDYFLTTGQISQSEHNYVKLPVNYLLNQIVQVVPKRHYDKLSMNILNKINIGKKAQYTIQSNIDNVFYASTQGLHNQRLTITVTKSAFQTLEITIGQHIIEQNINPNQIVLHCTTQTCTINYFLKKYESNNLYINIYGKNDIMIYGNIQIEISDPTVKTISLTQQSEIQLTTEVSYQSLNIQNLPHIIDNMNNMYHALYCIVYFTHKNEYCLTTKTYLEFDLQSSDNTIQTPIRCINQYGSYNATIIPHLIWSFPNTSVINGPVIQNMHMWITIVYRLNYIYYLQTNNTDSFTYILSDKPCDNYQTEEGCTPLVWEKNNITLIRNKEFLSIIHGAVNQQSRFQLELIKVRVMQVNINYNFRNRNQHYLMNEFLAENCTSCTVEPSVNISGMTEGCVASSDELSMLNLITSCLKKQPGVNLFTTNGLHSVAQQKSGNYKVYFKLLTNNINIMIQNIKYCEYGELMKTSNCRAVNIIQFDVPENNTQHVLVATNIDIIYNIINRNTSQEVEILGTFYSHTFLKAGVTFDLYFYCNEKQLQQQEIQFYISSQNIYPINDSQNISLKLDYVYIFTPKYNNILIKFKEGVTAEISQNGVNYDTMQVNSSILVRNSISLYMKFSKNIEAQVVQASNFYPNLVADLITIDYTKKVIVLPKIIDFLSLQNSNNQNFSNVSYAFYVNYNLYYNGTMDTIEIISSIYPDEVIRLNIMQGTDLLYVIDKVQIINSESQTSSFLRSAHTIPQVVLDGLFYMVISVGLLELLGIIAFIVILRYLNHGIIEERTSVQYRRQQLSASNNIAIV